MKKKKRRARKIDLLQTLRCGVVGLLLIYIAVLLYRAGGSDVPFDTVAAEVAGALDAESLDRADSQDIRRLYGISEGEQDGVLLYYQKATMGVEEVLLVRAKTEQGAREAAEAAEVRRDTQIANFEDYGPEQVGLLRDSILKVKGNYVLYVVSPQAGDVEAAFDKAL